MIDAVAFLLQILTELEIRFYAGGSVASSIHGIARYTQDLDLVVDLKLDMISLFAARLEAQFYADEQQMRESIRFGRSFNLIHLSSGFKIDIYPLPQDAFHRSEMARSAQHKWVIDAKHSVQLPVASAEDAVLSKLVWYRRGGEISDRQWNDVLGIAQTRQLDWGYLSSWASPLGVESLLDKLRTESH